MKKIFVAAAAVVVAGTVMFVACNKDPERTIRGSKMMGNLGAGSLQEYENYTPDEAIIEGKLLLINDCVNNQAENPLPDMEIKEAVWFLEAYFNIGVCQKQEYPVKYVDKEKTYLMTVPAEMSNGEIVLDGAGLQQQYRSVLTEILTTICPEYAINFGDVSVKSVVGNSVVLGLEILYGLKKEDFEIKDMEAPDPFFLTLKIVSDWVNPVEYPGDPDVTYEYKLYDIVTKEVEDEGMTITLNREGTWLIPTGIKSNVKDNNTDKPIYDLLNADTDGSESIYECYKKYHTYYGSTTKLFIGKWEYEEHGHATKYKDTIWNKLEPLLDPVLGVNNPLSEFFGYAPFWAKCTFKSDKKGQDLKSGSKVLVWHTWGIDKICIWKMPLPYMENIKCTFVP